MNNMQAQPQLQEQQQQVQQQQVQQLQQVEEAPKEVGDTHPLLKPKAGLSMSDALDKLNPAQGGDKLSDIDPQPKVGFQQLSNELIPSRFNVFADLKTPYVVGRDTPFFWHIPRSGGVVVKTLLSHCLGLTLSAEVGELEGHDKDEVR